MITTKTIIGEFYHEIEEMGNQKFAHIGFRDKENLFGEMIASIVPETGMKRQAKLTVELLE